MPIGRWRRRPTGRKRSAWSISRTHRARGPGHEGAPEERGTMTMTDCASCADERAAGAAFCEACGRQLSEDPAEPPCPNCGTAGGVGVDGYCEHCGMLAGRVRDHVEADCGAVAAGV